MIAHIKGILINKSPDWVVIDVNGVGYKLIVSLGTFSHLPEVGENILLHTYTYVREDALQLYGFFDLEEKKIFQLLIGVSKIGPRLARNILSGLPAKELAQAISAGNVAAISAVPGVGRKTAERMIIELQDKVGAVSGEVSDTFKPSVKSAQEIDAVSALLNLGYKQQAAQKIVKQVLAEQEEISLDKLIKEALRRLGSG